MVTSTSGHSGQLQRATWHLATCSLFSFLQTVAPTGRALSRAPCWPPADPRSTCVASKARRSETEGRLPGSGAEGRVPSSPGGTRGEALTAVLPSPTAASTRTPPHPPNLPSSLRPTPDTRHMQLGPGGVGRRGMCQEPQDFLQASRASDTELVGSQGARR